MSRRTASVRLAAEGLGGCTVLFEPDRTGTDEVGWFALCRPRANSDAGGYGATHTVDAGRSP